MALSDVAQASGGFSTETDEDLLVFMTMREEDRGGAQEAFEEFYRRHVHYLHYICRTTYEGVVGKGDIIDLVQETFWRVYQKADTYKPLTSTHVEPSRRVRAWMGTIAANILRSKLRRGHSAAQSIDDLDGKDQIVLSQPPPDCVDQAPGLRLKCLGEALETLSERERDILRMWGLHYKPGEKFQRLPDDVSQWLSATWKTTPENIRQVRKRAVDKIRQYVETCEQKSE